MNRRYSSRAYIPVLYAENCPEQPIILENNVLHQSKVSHHNPSFEKLVYLGENLKKLKRLPKMLIGTSSSWYENKQHSRQLLILQKRIKNCKSLTQRKKDHNDPILYPAIFIRDKKMCKDSSIDELYKNIMKEKKSRKPRQNYKQSEPMKQPKFKLKQTNKHPLNVSLYESDLHSAKMKIPLVSKAEQQWRSQQNIHIPNLPQCDSKSILDFILKKKLFLNSDLKILKSRLGHYYGPSIERPWNMTLYLLLNRKRE